jgi:hypothetical protein
MKEQHGVSTRSTRSRWVLVWFDGLARFEAASAGECGGALAVDGLPLTGERSDDDDCFNLNGQRIVDLDACAPALALQASVVDSDGTMPLDASGPYQTCISYLVLGAE